MGLFKRLADRRRSSVSAQVRPPAREFLLDGQDDLEVVGELPHQAVLWQLCGGSVGKRIRHGIVAVLAPEPTNPHDANAIAVQIDGHVVGYLPRAAAQEYLPSLKHLMSVRGGVIALRGVIAAAATAMTGRDDSACG